MLNCGTPLMHAFMPLVPLASSGFRGIVQPDVAALNQEVRDVEVVVLDEGDAAGKDRVERAAEDALHVVLAGVVGRMRLAGKDESAPAGPARSGCAPADRDRERSARAACSR